MRPPPLICLITPGHVSTTPRLVKNADALAEAGYRVHVVAGAPFPPADRLDAEIVTASRWAYTRANFRGGLGGFGRKLARRAARGLAALRGPLPTGLAARALFDESRRLAEAAAAVGAQFYFGHCLAGLAAAAGAGRERGVPHGFDIEDYHDAETEQALADPVERRIRRALQERLLPGCAPLTCSSPLIARRYAEQYGVRPLVVLNVFPLSHAPAARPDPEPITEERPAVFYWFSQTVGPDRGLEDTVAALARMVTPVELHLRGFVAPGYSASLQALATRSGLTRPLRFLPPDSPVEMVRLAARADMGLSVERSIPANRDICLTNKVFVYLLAGIPQLMSDTAAQSALAPDLGGAAILCTLANAAETAARLDGFFADPARVAAARTAARRAAEGRFCWDVEKAAFMKAMKATVPPPA